MSHPEWVRGLKPIDVLNKASVEVAPRVGAWIETRKQKYQLCIISSHPEWVRGLKLSTLQDVGRTAGSHPEWVRGLKLVCGALIAHNCQSHPEWVRGLKLTRTHTYCPFSQSHPEWVRGLKLLMPLRLIWLSGRTPSGCVD